jgi:hypothetical protein
MWTKLELSVMSKYLTCCCSQRCPTIIICNVKTNNVIQQQLKKVNMAI